MANAQKYTRAACGHLAAHYERRKDEKGEYVKFGNQDIDPQKTHLNYNLGPRRGLEQIDFIRQRTTEARTLKRDDVNVMCSWVVTLPEYRHHNQSLHVSPDKEQVERLFFERSYRFLCDRYGEQNVISAYVHKDEKTPHMHFAFVPVKHGFKEDKKNPDISTEYRKVSAKEVLNRRELQAFHPALQRYVERELGHEVSILNEATKEGNKSIEELKRQTATERLQEANEKAAQIVSKAREGVKVVEQDIQALEGKKTALEGEIEALEVKLQGRQLQIREVMEIKPEYEKGLFGSVKGIKGVTVSDIENLKATAIKGLEARDRLEKLTFEYERVKKLVPTMDERMRDAQDKIRLEQLEKAFQRLPEHIQKQLLPAKSKSHDRGRER